MREIASKIKLISYTKNPEKVISAAVRQCYSSKSAAQLMQKITPQKRGELIRLVISSGHTSTIEHVSFTFTIEGVSRSMTHELVRHRIASYSQQSQRYVSAADFKYIVPPTIRSNKKLLKKYKDELILIKNLYEEMVNDGIPKEDARFILPNACETKIVVTMNARSLFNFLARRMCNRAQWEIRFVAHQMHKLLMKVAPNVFKFAGPTCKTEDICWEGERNCGIPAKLKKIKLLSHVK